MKTNDLLILGGLAVGAYFLYKSGLLDQLLGLQGGYGGGGGSGGGGGDQDLTFVPAPDASKEAGEEMVMPVYKRQGWTNTEFGDAGQPSVTFAKRTIQQAKSGNAPQNVVNAAAAIYAGAPPRVAAKIKAGKWG